MIIFSVTKPKQHLPAVLLCSWANAVSKTSTYIIVVPQKASPLTRHCYSAGPQVPSQSSYVTHSSTPPRLSLSKVCTHARTAPTPTQQQSSV